MNSIYTGLSGMQATQEAMNVIANNVANLNTVAFKAGQTSFEETLVQTLSDGSTSGQNPIQLGLGVSVGSIDNLMTQGTPQSTGNPLDLMINGNGYFVTSNGQNQILTRNGQCQLDGNNTLVNESSGMPLMGWQADLSTGTVDTSVPPSNSITIPIGNSYAVPTSTAQLGGDGFNGDDRQ